MSTELKLPFDHVAAHAHLSAKDKRLAKLILKNGEYKFKLDDCDSVYESLLEAIVHQSISGKAAAKIYSRIKALGTDGACPTPQQIFKSFGADVARSRPFERESGGDARPRTKNDRRHRADS